MSSALPQPSLYAQLEALPENCVGEILDGRLYTQPRPAPPHLQAATRLGSILDATFGNKYGTRGGWRILAEPEIHFLRKIEVDVPDVAAWRLARMPRLPRTAFIEIVPDWVCEVLSPNTAGKDRSIKMPIYARFGVPFAWLIDPDARTLEAFALTDGAWTPVGRFGGTETVAAQPFDASAFPLDWLWE